MDDGDRDLETLRRSVERVGQGVEAPDAAGLESAVRRGRRRRRVRIGVGLVAGLTLAAGVALPLHALLPLARSLDSPGGVGSPGISQDPPIHPGWVTYQLPQEGVSIQAPSGWMLVQDPIPSLADPAVLFELASYFEPSAPSTGCAPAAAIATPGDQVLVWLSEYASPPDSLAFAPRADPFPLENLSNYECVGRPGYLTRFVDQGRYFQLQAVFGPNASDVLRQHVIDSLGSLQVDPAGAAGPDQNAAASWLSPPTFVPAPGWNTESTGPNGSPSIARDESPVAWASNRPFANADLADLNAGVLTGRVESWPDHTIASLSSGQVVMVADLPMPGYTAPTDLAEWPVRPQPMNVHGAIGPVEGGQQFVLTASINGQFVEVRFFYPSDTPTDAELATAQQELNRLVVPSLPPSRS